MPSVHILSSPNIVATILGYTFTNILLEWQVLLLPDNIYSGLCRVLCLSTFIYYERPGVIESYSCKKMNEFLTLFHHYLFLYLSYATAVLLLE